MGRSVVIWGTGFIGSHTVDLLLEKGYSVRIIDSLELQVHPQQQKPAYISDDVEFILGDVCNRSDLEKALLNVDYVFHLAAYQGYLPDFSRFAQINEVSTALLYEIIANNREYNAFNFLISDSGFLSTSYSSHI